MATYTYTVQVNVNIDTDKMNTGKREQQQILRSMEQDVIDSQRRINSELDASANKAKARNQSVDREEQNFLNAKRQRQQIETQSNQDEAQRRFNAKQADFRKQIDQQAAFYKHSNDLQQQLNKRHLEQDKAFWKDKLRNHAEGEGAKIRQMQQTAELERKLQAASPFYNAQFRQQSTRNAGFEAKFAQDTQFNRDIRKLDPFQSANNRSLKQASKDLAEFDAQTKKSTQSTSMWGQAFKGAFIGAIAGMTFSLLIGGITTLISKTAELGITSVQLAGDFEVTTNALAAFTGSTRSARKELEEIGKVAENTPGLRLETAEQGFQKLRALGFEAQQAKSFIKELGEEKILSGASDEALDKIIFNFAQIASGGQKVSQELREILTQMPSMKNAFFDAFGTLDPKKIQTFFDKDTDDAFKRLTDAMANQKAAAGGLNDAWGKASDAVIKAGREFGEPFLKQVTRDLKDLTKFLQENAGYWRDLGQEIADFYNGLSILTRSVDGESGIFGAVFGAAESEIDRQTNGIYSKLKETVGLVKELGRLQREMTDYANASPRDKTRMQATSILGTGIASGALMSDQDILDSQGEAKTTILNAQKDIVVLEQKAVQERLSIIQDYNNEKISIIESANRREIALLDNQVTYSLEQEIEVANKRAAIVDKGLREQFENYSAYYAEVLELNQGNEIEIQKITVERNQKLRGIADQVFENELRRQREVAEKQRQIDEKLRQDKIASLDLLSREYKQSYDTRVFDLQRAIDREIVSAETGYDQLRQITVDNLEFETTRIRDEYALRLQDKSLTNQEIINLERERDLSIAELEINAQRRQQEIEDKKRDAFVKNLTFQKEVMQSYLQDLSSIASTFGDVFFDNSVFSSARLEAFQKVVLKQGQRDLVQKDLDKAQKDFDDNLANWNKFKEQLKSINGFAGTDNEEQKASWEGFSQNFDKAQASITELESEMTKINDTIPKTYFEFERLAKLAGAGAVDGFDRLNEAILKHRQNLDRSDAQADVDYYDTLIKSETDLGKLREYNFNLEKAQRRLQRLDYDQSAESADAFAKSIKGLEQAISELENKDPLKMAALKDAFRKEDLEERRNTLVEIRRLEYDLANPDLNAANEQKLAILQKMVDMRNQEADALTRIEIAELEIANQGNYSPNQDRANVLEFLAQQKNVTELLSDAKINLITKAYDGLDTVIGKLTKRFGVFGDAIKDLLSGLIKLALNKVFQKLFGGQSGGNNGFSLPNFGGGNGIGQTPNFNPFGGSGNFGANSPTGSILTLPNGQQVFNVNGNSNIPPVKYMSDGTIQFASLANQLPSPQSPNGGTGAMGGFKGMLGSLLPMLGGSLGGMLGQGNSGASMLGSIGGLAGGLAASIGTGLLSQGATAGFSLFGTVISATAATGILAAVAVPALLGAYFWGRNSRRRKEEKLREKAIGDAFKGLDKLIEQVRNDQIDGNQAIEQAETIKQQFIDSANQLKDKKTRTHALKDVARIDAKISELKTAVASQNARRQRLELYAPTFADGGSLSKFANDNFRHNPLGYQRGGQKLGYFPASKEYAIYNERGSEYIFDAETTRNVGTDKLDLIRHTKGQALNSMLFRWNDVQHKADGGSLIVNQISTPQAQSSSAPVQIVVQTNGTALEQLIVESLSMILVSNNGSQQQLNAIASKLENDGQNKFIEIIVGKVLEKIGK